jgi:two-component system, NtrC family, response regulator AtoC
MNEAQTKETVMTEDQTQSGAQSPSNGAAVLAPTNGNPAPWAALRSLRAETEIHAISRALEESGWNRKHAAKLLSISYRGLLYKIRQYNITPASSNTLAQAQRPQM